MQLTKLNIKWLSLIIFSTFILYVKVIFFDFVSYDDNIYITSNQYIQQVALENVKYIFTHQFFGHYFPFTLSVHMLENFFFGLNPMYFHLISLIIHLLNVVLVFFILKRFDLSDALALLATAIFAVHPMNVETVAWLGARNNIQSSFFYFSSFLFYANYVQFNKWQSYVWCLALFVLALFSKSSAVTLALLVVAFDVYSRRRYSWVVILDKIPFFTLAIITAFIATNAAKTFGSVEDFSVNFNFIDRPFLISFPIWIYFSKLIFPYDLRLKYHNPARLDEFLPTEYYWSIAIIVVLGFIWYFHPNRRRGFFLLFLFLINISLVLKITFSTNVIAAERYIYIAYLGLIPFVIETIHHQLNKWRINKVVQFIFGVTFLMFLSIKSYNRMEVWRNSENLFNSVMAQDGDKGKSHLFLGITKFKSGEYEESIIYFNNALRLDSQLYSVHYLRGLSHMLVNNYEAAALDLNRMLQKDSLNPNVNFQLGVLNARKEQFDIAKTFFERTINLDTKNTDAYFLLANIYIQSSNYNKARKYLESCVAVDPKYKEAWFNLGGIYYELDELPKACNAWLKAAELGVIEANQKAYNVCM